MNWFQKVIAAIGGIDIPTTVQTVEKVEQEVVQAGLDIEQVIKAPSVNNIQIAMTSTTNVKQDLQTALANDPNLAGIHKFIDTVAALPRVKDTESKFLAAADILKVNGAGLAADGQTFLTTLNSLVVDTGNKQSGAMAADIAKLEQELVDANKRLVDSRKVLSDALNDISIAGGAIRDEFAVILRNIQVHVKP